MRDFSMKVAGLLAAWNAVCLRTVGAYAYARQEKAIPTETKTTVGQPSDWRFACGAAALCRLRLARSGSICWL